MSFGRRETSQLLYRRNAKPASERITIPTTCGNFSVNCSEHPALAQILNLKGTVTGTGNTLHVDMNFGVSNI